MRIPLLITLLTVLCAGAAPAADTTVRFQVDCTKETGRIRPLHGGNCGPLQTGGLIDLSAYHKELGIPLTRLHDCHWPNPDVVDVHVVFPDFTKDPADPKSYDFARSDDYVAAVVKTGSKIVYRLGESIEHAPRKVHVNPPGDAERWAQVCVGIIRHYNEGWADGFRHDIQYWEIWNEPENRPAMWTGGDEEYLRLYEVTAKAIKSQFPNLKAGGPSLGYTGRVVDGGFEPSPFLLKFLSHCRDRKLPLDFFSWHLYTNDPRECVTRALGIRRVLDENGFRDAESHLNEWNYLPDNDWSPMSLKGQGEPREKFYARMTGAEGAAFAAAVLLNLQDAPVDAANYFTADNQPLGLFSLHGVPHKTFHAFKAFRMLLDTPERLPVTGRAEGLSACAGTDEKRSAVQVLVANPTAKPARCEIVFDSLPWHSARGRVLLLDTDHGLSEKSDVAVNAGASVTIELTVRSVYLVTVSPAPFLKPHSPPCR